MQSDFSLEKDMKAGVLVLVTYEDADTPDFKRYDARFGGELSRLKKRGELLGKWKRTKLVSGTPHAVIVAGLGDKKGFKVTRYLAALEAGVRAARKEGFTHVGVLVQDLGLKGMAAELVAEAALATARVFDKYRAETKKDLQLIKRLTIVGAAGHKKGFKRGQIIAEAVNRTRDLQDTTAADCYPESFAKEARATARKHKLACTVWDEKELKKRKCNAILAVGQGSVHKPRLVTLRYKAPGAKKTVCLVGKGITFDTGGINLKPTGWLEDMKYDMSGAGVVLGIMEAVARLKPKVNVVGIMGMAENAIDGGAYIPSDVIKTAAGITVEVANTDAEGRLVLADSLHHAQSFKPDHIVDFATLTGAVVVALGSVCAGVMGTDQKLVDKLIKHGEATGERVWPLPLWEEYEEDIASEIADIKNLGYKREGGTITAGNFLQQFVGKASWAHLDIAGTAMIERPRHFTEKGGTGYSVRLVVDWLSNL